MKNPIAHLKHLIKDPINTIAEANERKKEIMPWMLGSVGFLVLVVVLMQFIESSIMTILSMVGLLVVAYFGLLLFIIKKAKERFECLTCSKCNTLAEIKTPEDFAKYISYSVEKDEAIFKGYTGNKEPSNGVYSLVQYNGTSTAVVSVRLTCPNCGEVKELVYTAEPFRCTAEARKVSARDILSVKLNLETAVKSAVDDYNDPEKKKSIPYTIHSSKNPHFAERTTFKGANASDAHPKYNGARLEMRQDVEEMLEHYFVIPQINGKLVDPSKSKKKK